MENNETYRVTASELKSFIERFERLAGEKQDIADQQKEVLFEAKARGYDVKVIKRIITERKRSPEDLSEEDAIHDLYMDALSVGDISVEVAA